MLGTEEPDLQFGFGCAYGTVSGNMGFFTYRNDAMSTN